MSADRGGAPFSLRRDAWLTEKFGRPVWQVRQGAEGEPWSVLTTSSPLFAYAKVETTDVTGAWHLAEAGFHVVDAALTFEAPAAVHGSDDGVRPAAPPDCEAVGRIAGSAFRYSRFHADPVIPRGLANAIKAEWATNFFTGARGDGMLVAERNGEVVGFTQLLWQRDDCLVIDLIGVDAAHQGKGIGRAMIAAVWRHGTGNGRRPSRLRVGTQVANTPSVRLYESMGFRLIGSQYILHLHRGRV